MDCPKCSRPLNRTTYENVRVMQCDECFGYLVVRKRLMLIKSTRELGPEALHQEAHAEQTPDTEEQLRCPNCLVEVMRKERVRVADDESFHLDVCRKCENVWLDGGELARLQIKFEQSAKAIEAFAHQERLQALSSDEQTELQDRIDNLSDSESVGHATAVDVLTYGGIGACLVAMFLTLILEYTRWSGVSSLVLCAWLVYLIISRPEATSDQRLWGAGLLGLAEVAYLACLFWFF
jgi:Zn-finger nucleic acid-binding protein